MLVYSERYVTWQPACYERTARSCSYICELDMKNAQVTAPSLSWLRDAESVILLFLEAMAAGFPRPFPLQPKIATMSARSAFDCYGIRGIIDIAGVSQSETVVDIGTDRSRAVFSHTEAKRDQLQQYRGHGGSISFINNTDRSVAVAPIIVCFRV